MASLDQFDSVVRRIYAAASDFALWPDALSAIEDVSGSVGAVIDFIPRGGQQPLTLAGRFTPEQCATYSREYQHICPRIRFAVEHPEVAISCDAIVLSEAEMDRDPVYDWFGKHGLRYYVGTHLTPTDSHFIFTSLQRSPQQGHVQREDIELFDLLRGHLSQAVAIAARLGTLESGLGLSLGLLNGLPQAIFALGTVGEVVFANAAAERLMARRDGITVAHGRLALWRGDQQAEFDRLLQLTLASGTSAPNGWMRVDRPSGKRPYAALVSRFEMEKAHFPHHEARTIVVFHEPERELAVEDALRPLFGLTPAEARLAATLVEGHSLASAAAMLGVSPETIRVHLKALFRKTRTNRQQDLIRLLVSLE